MTGTSGPIALGSLARDCRKRRDATGLSCGSHGLFVPPKNLASIGDDMMVVLISSENCIANCTALPNACQYSRLRIRA